MGQSQSNRAALYFSEEITWNETPSSPIMTALPYTSESLGHQKQTIVSNQIRDDRMRDTVAEVAVSAEGDINFELQYTDFQKFFEAALGGTFTTFSYTGAGTAGNLQFSGNDIIAPANTWAGLVVGQYVKITGAAQSGNNGIRKVTAKSSTNLTVDGAAFTAEDNSTATVTGKVLRNGVVRKSFLIEKRFADIGKYFYFRGMRVGQLRLALESEQMITGSMSFMGAEGVPANASIGNATSNPESSDGVMNATANVGNLTEGGVSLVTAIRSIHLTVNNNLRKLSKLASRTAGDINYGTLDVTGTLEAYFEDVALLQKFINHAQSSLSFRATDPAGKVLIFTIPALYFLNGNPTVGGLNQDIMLPLEWQAIRDANTNCQIQIDAL